ncbi:MAG: hypothetical protein LIO96_14955 [Lachnospiraceae bacterium]|nr:hypothetical protein [Lachnospiraceae bacterium]
MAVYIGHASISENGTVQGEAGDQTKKEVCTRTWYSKPWDFMAIHPDATVREKHAKAIEEACANDDIGYSQGGSDNRNTLYNQAKAVNFDLSEIKTKCNCDCSSLQNVGAIASGAVSVASYGSNGWTTSVMKAKLAEAGYKIITDDTYLKSADYCVRGAIYVKSGSHTVCGLTNGSKYQDTLAKAGLTTKTTASSSAGTSTTATKPTYKIGSVYTTQVDELNVRKGPGTSYGKVTYANLTTNAKQNAYKNGQLKKGTRVTCKEARAVGNDVWMRIPSGWIAAYYKGKAYVK